MKILILGGYGTFGGRLAHLLAEEKRLTLILAGRSIQKAKRFCEGLPSGAQKVPAFFFVKIDHIQFFWISLYIHKASLREPSLDILGFLQAL